MNEALLRWRKIDNYALCVFFAAGGSLLPALSGRRRSILAIKCLYRKQENHQRLRRFSRFFNPSASLSAGSERTRFDKCLFGSGLSRLGMYGNY